MLSLADVSFLIAISFAGSLHCAGMCGGIYCAVEKKVTFGFVQYFLGRLFTYTWIGALLGSFGLIVGNAFNQNLISLRIVAAFIGLLMVIGAIASFSGRSIHSSLTENFSSYLSRFLKLIFPTYFKLKKFRLFFLGFVSGILPCGLLWSVELQAMATGSLTKGALLMALFCVITSSFILFSGKVLETINQVRLFQKLKLGEFAVALMGVHIIYRSSQGIDLLACLPSL